MKNRPPSRKPFFAVLLFVVATLSTVCCHEGKPSSAQRAEAEMWMNKENDFFQEALFDSCLIFLDKADSLAAGDDTVRAYTTAERAVILGNQGRMAEAIPYAKKSAELSEKIEDYETLLNMYATLGVLYRRIGENDSAIISYKKGISIAHKVDAKDYVANLMNNIASLFALQDRTAEAMTYAKQAEHWAKVAKDTTELYNALGMKASLFARQGKYKEARGVIEPYYEDIMHMSSIPHILKCTAPLLTAYTELGMTDEAEKQINRLKPMMKKLETANMGNIGIYEIEAKLYNKRKEYRKELDTWNFIDSLNQKNQSINPQELLFHKAECYNNLGNKTEALRLMRQAYTVSDSLKNSNIGRQMSELSIKYKTQEKELELSRVKQEKAEQQVGTYFTIILLVIVCALFIVFVIYYMYRRRTLRQAYELDMRRRFIDGIEKERARLSRELHDGTCNDLLGLSMMIDRGDNHSLETVKHIRDNVRRISHELMPPRFTKVDIDTVLHDYVEHFPIDNCDIKYASQNDKPWHTVPDNVAYEYYRIVQEAIGNIVKHSHPTHIAVNLSLCDKTLQLSISNDGVPTDQHTTSTGIGTQTIKDRVNNIGGTVYTKNADSEYILTVSTSTNAKH